MRMTALTVAAGVLAVACSGESGAPPAQDAGAMESQPASAETAATEGALKIANPFVRAPLASQSTSAAYFQLENTGDEPDRLISVASPIAEAIEIHSHVHDNGTMAMRRVDGVDIAAGETALFEPGGHHIMLIGLTAPLVEGEAATLTLTFASGHKIEIDAPIKGYDGD